MNQKTDTYKSVIPKGCIHIRKADWQKDQTSIREIRTEVFIIEQRIPENEEFDSADAMAVHILAFDETGDVAGTARLLDKKKIGRVAVLKNRRGTGIGKAIILYMMKLAGEYGSQVVELDAQVYAIPFYEKLGFQVTGREFMDTGIPHKKMIHHFNSATGK